MNYYFHALSPRRGLHIVVQSPGGELRNWMLLLRVREGNILDDNLARKEGPKQHRFYKEATLQCGR